jgi:hypothetical protein
MISSAAEAKKEKASLFNHPGGGEGGGGGKEGGGRGRGVTKNGVGKKPKKTKRVHRPTHRKRLFFIPIGSLKRFKSLWCDLFRFVAIAQKKTIIYETLKKSTYG